MTASTDSRARLLPLVLAVGTALSLASCSSDAPTAIDDGPCATSSSADAAGSRPIELPNAEVTVTDPGTGDRKVPQPKPDVTSPQRVTLTTDSTETSVAPSGNDDQSGVQTIAQTLTTPLTARANCTDPNDLAFTMGTPESPDKALAPELEAMDGSTGGVSYLAGLTPATLRIAPNDAASSPARSAVEQSLVGAFTHAVSLPTTPIGAGATWRSVRTVTSATTVTQTIDVTLKSWEGNVLTLDVNLDEVPANSTFQIPGSAETLQITRYSMSGKGTLTVDLSRQLPTGGSVSMNGARELVGSDPNRPILQRTGFEMSWTPTK